MPKLIRKVIRQILLFTCDQYVVLLLILATSVKLVFFNTYIIKTTWAMDQYYQGLFFSVFSAALIFSPLYFVRKYKNKIAILLAIIISIILFVDTIYFSYFEALPSVGLLSSLGQVADIGPAIGGVFQWQSLLYFMDVFLIIILSKKTNSYIKDNRNKHSHIKSTKIIPCLMATVALALVVIQIFVMDINRLRDVFNKGFDMVSTAQCYGVLGTHVIDISRFINQETTHLSSVQKKEVADWVKNNQPAQISTKFNGLAAGKNVIIVQIESLGGFVINQKVNNKEITPTLNQLAQTSQFFPNDRFIISAGHTSDTDFVANSSYFPLDDAAVFVKYGQDNFTSLPRTLAANNYSTYAYHGFNRDFWNRSNALSSLGYQKFYAADSYPKGIVINMGLNDGDFLSKTADYIKNQPKPSLSYVITLSSHTPFTITDQTKELGINPNDYPQQVGGYLEDINYTDRMLGNFFTKLKSEGLYDDSLVVVFGDHTPVLPAFTAGTIKYDPETVQEKEVPLFVKLPESAGVTSKTYSNQGTHLDITPTILDLLGIKTNQLMFGQSLFAEKASALKICTDQLAIFPISNNCQSDLSEEQSRSETIIRYNLFNILPK